MLKCFNYYIIVRVQVQVSSRFRGLGAREQRRHIHVTLFKAMKCYKVLHDTWNCFLAYVNVECLKAMRIKPREIQ